MDERNAHPPYIRATRPKGDSMTAKTEENIDVLKEELQTLRKQIESLQGRGTRRFGPHRSGGRGP